MNELFEQESFLSFSPPVTFYHNSIPPEYFKNPATYFVIEVQSRMLTRDCSSSTQVDVGRRLNREREKIGSLSDRGSCFFELRGRGDWFSWIDTFGKRDLGDLLVGKERRGSDERWRRLDEFGEGFVDDLLLFPLE
jgi:hypothetical protein